MLELIGYGARLVLNHPAQLGRLAPEMAPAPDTAILARPGEDGRKILIAPGARPQQGDFELVKLQEAGMEGWVFQQSDDGTRVVLGDEKSLGDLAELASGPKSDKWELKSSKGYAGLWLEGYNVLTTDEDTTWPFELVGHDTSLIYVRGPMRPSQLPAAEELAVQDQELVRDETDGDRPWAELAYQANGDDWRLSYHFNYANERAALVVCCQAPKNGAEKAQERAWEFTDSLRLA